VRWRAAIVLAAAVAAFAPIPPSAVERFYSTGLYLQLQPRITAASNDVPFALLDLFGIVVVAGWLLALVRDLGRRNRFGGARVAGRALVRSVVWAAALYLAFLALWGLNSRRVPLADRLQFDPAAVSAPSARTLALTAADRLNALYDEAHAAGWPPRGTIDPGLAAALAETERALGARRVARPATPKPSLLDPYFRRAAVDGMTDPFFLETLVSTDLLPFERPFVIAHEWSHLAGYADEGEANFVGWLACLGGAAADRYSGWLFLYGELAGAAGPGSRADVRARLAPGPRADLRAIAERIARHLNPTVSRVGWRVYDRYLKANRVEAGAASYGGVVRLALGTRFGPDWTPRLR